MATDNVIDIDSVWTQYGDIVIHRDLTLGVHYGEVMAIIGGSGSGKTTLLRLMLGLEGPSRGTIKVFGVPLQGCAAGDLRQTRNRWGVLFQEGALFSALSVFDNVALPLRELKALPEDVIRELVMMKLDLVEIDTISVNKMPAELSGGMVKRVALARALALNPELLFLDEPTAGLDPERSHGFVQLIESLRRALNLTVVMVTHDVDTLLALSDRVAVLANQQLLTVGPLWEIVQNKDPFVQNFFLGHGKRCEQENIKDFRDKMAVRLHAA
ncbi:Methionine ABC transporter ATP-binding protein [Collimonas arenae]|uniref:Methionine ABC transporter ATP-binding protein n=1 Tax=Collimonas arenae TaxID=279058 RepID=A0A0A1FEL9_9BURK|nr:ATP-binding cassette domain-containing protein [Collimonas arenae]AIY42956.1 Methionine ABC transporter ATP-binding protein [Collimonas arenae]